MNDSWKHASALLGSQDTQAQKMFILYCHDVEGTIIAYGLFEKSKSSKNTRDIPKIIYHASSFICAARRAGRLLEALSRTRSYFLPQVRETIKNEWKKNRAFFEDLRLVRNAIEHIDSQDYNKTKMSFFNLNGNNLQVTKDYKFTIDQSNLDKIVSSRNIITQAILDS